MLKDWVIFTICIAIIVALAMFSYHTTGTRRSKCNALGGVYIEYQCFKTELIRMED